MKKQRSTQNPLALWALIIAVAVVLARGTMLESVRDPFEVTPGSKPYARGAGAAAGLVLDLLCCVPALMVLMGRVVKRDAIARSSWGCRLGGVLALWTGASVFWASDKFAAAVSAAHVGAAMAILWACAQVVTSWPRLRLVAALAHGLLMVYIVQAVLYKYVELPATLQSYEANKAEFLHERGWKPDEFLARQFEKKLMNGEMVFFHGSANSFAATLVLLLGVSGGLVLGRLANGDYVGAGLSGVVIPFALWILYYTHSKAALVTPVLIAGILLVAWRGKALLNYWAGVLLTAAGMGAVLAIGLIRHGLPSASLNFRWRYWTAAWRMFLARPILGVGWDNFGIHYLRYRLAEAAEEIQDPHNFLVRWATELGVVGLGLGIAWMGRIWWEMSRASLPGESSEPRRGIGLITGIAAAGMGINCLASLDYSRSGSFVIIEIMKRLLFVCVLVVGACMAGLRSMKESDVEDRPAPWMLYALLASLGAFVVHNLIEFSLFETGPMMLFALLAGSALGMRTREVRPSRAGTGLILGIGAVAWLGALFVLVIPVIQAESLTDEGDDLVRAGRLDEASRDFLAAYQDHVAFNSDYLNRAAMALAYKPGGDREAVRKLFDETVEADPSMVVYHLSRGRIEAEMRDGPAAAADFAAALELNPNEVSIHLEYADLLSRVGRGDEATGQYQAALNYNHLLPADEPKRINDGEIRAHYALALAGMGKGAEAAEQARRGLADDAALGADDPRRLDADTVKRLREMAQSPTPGGKSAL